LIVVEMEAEGILTAVVDRREMLGTLVIRGIYDMSIARKGDERQEYAANAVIPGKGDLSNWRLITRCQFICPRFV